MARILLADDDAASRDLVRRALTADGHVVDDAQDGLEAAERLEAARGEYDLLVSDVQMPGLDGIALAHRALAAAPGLAVILISGYAEQLDRAAALKAKRLATLVKPFTLEQIRAAVRAALS